MVTVPNRHAVESSRRHYLFQLMSVVALFILFLSLMSASDAVEGGAGRKLFLLGRMAVLVLLCTWFLRRGGERWTDMGLRRPRRWWTVPLLAVGGFVAIVVLNEIIRGVVLPALGALPPQVVRAGDLPGYLFALLTAWSSAAFGEELLLRGFVLDRIAKAIGSSGTPTLLVAIVAQAALFGTLHFYQGLGGMLVTGMVGLVMGFLWLMGGRNLWACILLHGVINTISAIEAFSQTPM